MYRSDTNDGIDKVRRRFRGAGVPNVTVVDATIDTARRAAGRRLGLAPKASVTVGVVIPTLNEASNLPHVLTRIPAMVDEIVLVDGRSIDDTIAVARMLRPDIRVLRHHRHA